MESQIPQLGKALQDKKYDAYIGYAHAEPDMTIARLLSKEILKYRIPKGVLPREASLMFNDIVVQNPHEINNDTVSDSVKSVLNDSRYLIIICSPKAKESPWIQSLIDYFISLGGKTRIVVVLAEGEPKTSFPPQLFETKTIRKLNADGSISEVHEIAEPLAADIRAETAKKSLKLLKHAKLKVIAALIGCAYDNLARRHYRRSQQKLVSMIAVIGAVSLLITALFSYLAIKALNQAEISKLQTRMANDILQRIYVEMPKAFSNVPEALPYVEALMMYNMETLLKSDKSKAVNIDTSELLACNSSESYGSKVRKAVLLRQLGKGRDGLLILKEEAKIQGWDDMYLKAAEWLYGKRNDYGATLYVCSLDEDGSATEAGIEAGDIITKIDYKTFVSSEEFTAYISELGNQKTSIAILHRKNDGTYEEKAFRVRLKDGRLGISYLPI